MTKTTAKSTAKSTARSTVPETSRSAGRTRRLLGALLGEGVDQLAAQWRGHLLTVLDLPQLLGHATPNGPACLVRLAPPLQGTSLFLPVNVRMATLASPTPAAEPGAAETVEHESRLIRLIDPSTLVRRTEKQFQEGRPA